MRASVAAGIDSPPPDCRVKCSFSVPLLHPQAAGDVVLQEIRLSWPGGLARERKQDAHAEGLTARLATDFLRAGSTKAGWRTWLTDAASLSDAQGEWTPEWIASRGEPNRLGGIVSVDWQ